jgi:PiT family inorganic phosphate transporter
MDPTLVSVVALIGVALTFDFINGFHDAANSIATVVSTRVLTPGQAVAWAALFNFVAAFTFGTAVASTIGKGMIDINVVTFAVIFCGLFGAIVWDVITWYVGLPTSSSHALVGGMAGAAVASAGWGSLLSEGLQKIAVFIVLSPIIGLLLGFTIMVIVFWLFHRYRKVDKLNRGFRRTQLVSAAAFSLGHGANDAQKTMGVILALLIANKEVPPTASVPLWVVLGAHTAIGLGTLFGGWRIVHTMGSRITKLNPVGGMSAELAAASTLFFTAHAGIPVSTTHTITGAIVGVGTTQRLAAVRWGVAGRVVWAWILTIPGSFLVAWLAYQPIRWFS